MSEELTYLEAYFPRIKNNVNSFNKNFDNEEYVACAMYLRKILEGILGSKLGSDYGKIKNNKIQVGIDSLNISNDYKSILHGVRILGNKGSHEDAQITYSDISKYIKSFLNNESLASALANASYSLSDEYEDSNEAYSSSYSNKDSDYTRSDLSKYTSNFTILQGMAFVAQILIFLGLMRTRWSIPLLIEDSWGWLLVMPLIAIKVILVVLIMIFIAFVNWVFPGFADIVTNTLDNYSSPGLLIFNIILGALIIFYITKHYIFAFYKGLKERVYTTALIGLAGLFFSTLGIINMIGTENGFIPSTHNNKNIKNEYCTVLDDTSLIKKPVDKVENIKEDVEVYKGTNLLMTGRYAKVEDVTYVEVYLDSEKKGKTEWIDSRYLNIWQEFAK